MDPGPVEIRHRVTSPPSNKQHDSARSPLSANGEPSANVITPQSDLEFPERMSIQPHTLFPHGQEVYASYSPSFVPAASSPPFWGQPTYGNFPPYGVYHQPNHQMSSQRQVSEPECEGPPKSPRCNRRFLPGSPPPGTRPLPFPDKLYQLIDEAQAEGKSDIISFFSHGRAFVIHDPTRFSEEIMPRFFNQTKLASFQRQLNLYGFRRISRGPDSGGYYHVMFIRGRPDLCQYIRRTKVRGQHGGRLNNEDPNFYSMGLIDDSYFPVYSNGTGMRLGGTAMSQPMPSYPPHYSSPGPNYAPTQEYLSWNSQECAHHHSAGSFHDQRNAVAPQDVRELPPNRHQEPYDRMATYK